MYHSVTKPKTNCGGQISEGNLYFINTLNVIILLFHQDALKLQYICSNTNRSQ